MHFNYRYLLDFSEQQCHRRSGCAILDYGCGAGEVVIAGQERGLNIFGAEVFYIGGSTRQVVENRGLLGTTIREIKDGKLNFSDAYFDLVFSNQVLEHVEDLDAVLAEVNRVLKPGGITLNLFPSRDVWREGHCGIPFLHRFTTRSRFRYPYALFLRKLGLGYHKAAKSPEQWTRDFLAWLDSYCFYRDRSTIRKSFMRYFQVKFIEDDYVRARLEVSRLRVLKPTMQLFLVKSITNELFRKLGGLVLLATKPAEEASAENQMVAVTQDFLPR